MANGYIRISLAATLILTALSPSFAQFLKNTKYNTGNPNAAAGDALWTSAQYIDFSSTSAFPGRRWATFPSNKPPFFGGEKYTRFVLPPTTGAGNICYEISTGKSMLGANGPQDAETFNADTKLFHTYNTETDANILLNDDFGGTMYSKVRIWAKAGPSLNFSVAAYSIESNKIDFYLIIKSLKWGTPETCRLKDHDFFNL